jgi:hypothetical protein
MAHIVDRTGADALNSYLIDMLIPTDELDPELAWPEHSADLEARHDPRGAELDDDPDRDYEAEADRTG